MDNLHAPGLNGVCDSTENASIDKHVARHIDVVVLVYIFAVFVEDLRNPRLMNRGGGCT